jgi:hypothetical protein
MTTTLDSHEATLGMAGLVSQRGCPSDISLARRAQFSSLAPGWSLRRWLTADATAHVSGGLMADRGPPFQG